MTFELVYAVISGGAAKLSSVGWYAPSLERNMSSHPSPYLELKTTPVIGVQGSIPVPHD
jgi:hypothetical protein